MSDVVGRRAFVTLALLAAAACTFTGLGDYSLLCAPTVYQCSGEQPQQCNAAGTAWSNVGQPCGAGYQCSAGACVPCKGDAGQCGSKGVCTINAPSCNGKQPQVCNATGTALSDNGPVCSGSTPECSSGKCVVCVPGATQGCDDAQPLTCNQDGTALQPTGAPCSGKTPACVNGACAACPEGKTGVNGVCTGVCGPTQTQCSGNNYETCGTAGTWTSTACSSLCCNGACLGEQDEAQNCGACGRVCPSGSCSMGVCDVVLANGQDSPYRVVVDANSVYWTNRGGGGTSNGTVMKVPIDGGAATTLAVGQDNPAGIAIGGATVYWTNANGGSGGMVMSVPIAGGVVSTLASGQNFPAGIAVDTANVYWANYGGGTIMSQPLGGSGTATTLASGQSPLGVAVDATSVYWTNNIANGTVMSVPIDGSGSPTMLASGQPTPTDIAVHASAVYWTNAGNNGTGTVMGLTLGAATAMTLASGQAGANGIAVDATGVYWTNVGDLSFTAGGITGVSGSVVKVPLDGGTPTTLATDQPNAFGIAVDGTNVYWTPGTPANTPDGGSTGTAVMQAPK